MMPKVRKRNCFNQPSMETILTVFEIIALVAFTALCLALIYGVKQALHLFDKTSRSIDEATALMRNIEENITPVINTLNTTLKQTSETIEQVDKELKNASAIITHFRSVAERIDNLEQRLQQEVEQPLMQAASLISGISKAIIAFSETFGRKR